MATSRRWIRLTVSTLSLAILAVLHGVGPVAAQYNCHACTIDCEELNMNYWCGEVCDGMQASGECLLDEFEYCTDEYTAFIWIAECIQD